MKRIFIMCLILFGLALTLAAPLTALAQGSEQTKQVSEKAPQKGMPGCVSECKTCQAKCEATLNYCLKQGGKHTEAKHIQKLKDCIATCKISHDFMARGSDLSSKTCAVCAEACKRCAESCAQFKDKAMQDCAAECRKCQESCTSMAN